MVTHPGLRASDEDRQRVVAALERHTAAGRLSLDEFSERVGLVYAAATRGDLVGLTHDLPADDTSGSAFHAGAGRRQFPMALFLAALTIAVLGLVFAIAR